mgnify:CR=1 FL=1
MLRVSRASKRAAAHAIDDLAAPAASFIVAIEQTERPTPAL